MASKTFDGVQFVAWSDDHNPAHVHGKYAGIEVIIDLHAEDRTVSVSPRKKNPKPRTAKKSDVAYVLRTAAKYFDDLDELWEVA